MIKRLLIANRGEIAVRIARACRELGVESVAIYSDTDARAMHTWTADSAVHIGPSSAAESYLSIPRILEAASASGADAVHPGYGFLAESHEFASACEQAGLTFVGPPAAVIARMGSKIRARETVAAAGVPVVPGVTPADQSPEAVQRAVESIGYPALLKPAEGGGGKGMHRVAAPADVPGAVEMARREALAAFGDGTLYVERLIEPSRHVEVQVFGDRQGNVVHLFERDCSLQRRHQKVVEESPSPVVTDQLRCRMTAAAVKAAAAVSYQNAGTIEFLVDLTPGAEQAFYFLEMNTRLQVEHPVTEEVTGTDLVRAQLLVASGEPLPWLGQTLTQRGHAIEARVYAEDPARGFLPQTGRLLLYRESRMPGIRIDSGVGEGDEVTVHYDPLLAKVVSTAETRSLAIARLIAALRQFPILGVRTNIPFLLQLLEHPRFRAADFNTRFLETEDVMRGAARDVAGRVPSDPAQEKSLQLPEAVRAAFAAHTSGTPKSVAAGRSGTVDPWSHL
jgi:3-methylcrotonyl-CoA carboxylase alpha subunit